MADEKKPLTGPDLKSGVEFSKLNENEPLLGHYEEEAVLLVRKGDEIFATAATCTHYSGPLAEGLVVDETIRCPWHHARFDLRTGEAIGAPARNPISCYEVERTGGDVRIKAKKETGFRTACPLNPSSVVIVGAGAAGSACAEMLRTKGYSGPITLAGNEPPGPVDRPNLSKDYLAGNAPDEWIPLRPPDYYEEKKIDLLLDDPVARIQPAERKVSLKSGRSLNFGTLLLATGAEPRTLPIPGADLPHVFLLRTLADSNAIIEKAGIVKQKQGGPCAVIGSSFIGLEVAASLRARDLDVTVISQDPLPLAKILGDELGRFVQKLHEKHGVKFLFNAKPKALHKDRVELENGKSVDAAIVVLGVGVSPRTSLAEAAGLKVDNGVVVDSELRADADIFAAGDVAKYPEPVSGDQTRIEHWVVAQRQGQSAARTMLGIGGPFRDTPFFWSQHYDVAISYVGHASKWDSCEVLGNLDQSDAAVVYRKGKKVIALATIGRDQLSLKVEAAMEAGDDAAIESALRAG
ncbi:MAG TPA: FAD-dependent oxidoreductase [Bryobacteraceae bacterium]|nr:FAD-dependent oxidoreductase [Bryobacteraceae bacterium]